MENRCARLYVVCICMAMLMLTDNGLAQPMGELATPLEIAPLTQPKVEADNPREIELLPNSTIVSVGNAIEVLPSGWGETTAVAFGPGEHPSAPEGRILFASGKQIRVSDLGGKPVIDGDGNSVATWAPEFNETFPPYTIWDNHLVKLKNGDVLHTFEGITWNDPWKTKGGYSAAPPSPVRPAWWNDTVRFAAKREADRPGGRGKIWVFRSSDAGLTWEELPGIDGLTLSVPHPNQDMKKGAGVFGYPSELYCVDGPDGDWQKPIPCDDPENYPTASGLAGASGPDGHYTYADPYSGRVFISTNWAYGVPTGKEKPVEKYKKRNSFLILASSDNGETWKVISHKDLGQHAAWRYPLSSVPSGKVAISIPNSKKLPDGNFSLEITVFSTNTNWTELNRTFQMATIQPGSRSGIMGNYRNAYGRPGNRRLSRVLDGDGFRISAPNYEATYVQRVHYIEPDSNLGARQLGSSFSTPESGGNTIQGSFIEGLPDDDISVFYWRDQIPDSADEERYRIRFQVYRGASAILEQPGVLSRSNGVPYTWPIAKRGDGYVSPGSYMDGWAYRSTGRRTAIGESVRHFVAPWVQSGKLMFNTVTVKVTGDGNRVIAPNYRDSLVPRKPYRDDIRRGGADASNSR